MKTPLGFLLFLSGLGLSPFAQDGVPVTQAPPPNHRRAPRDVEQLLAPIALYPDALIALILPACTAPTDVVLAARHLRDSPHDVAHLENSSLDESVKSLSHYPELVVWMDTNLAWTKQVGETFTDQPADTLQAVQRLRVAARAAGTLVDTPQQQVFTENGALRIVPTQSDVIYIPYYEPDLVFIVQPPSYPRSYLRFSTGGPVGSWLAFECDWGRHTLWIGNRQRPWRGHDWRQPLIPITRVGVVTHAEVRPWQAPPRAAVIVTMQPPARVTRPSPIGPPRSVNLVSPPPRGPDSYQRLYGPAVIPPPPNARPNLTTPPRAFSRTAPNSLTTGSDAPATTATASRPSAPVAQVPPAPPAQPGVRPERRGEAGTQLVRKPAPNTVVATAPIATLSPSVIPPSAAAPNSAPTPPNSSRPRRADAATTSGRTDQINSETPPLRRPPVGPEILGNVRSSPPPLSPAAPSQSSSRPTAMPGPPRSPNPRNSNPTTPPPNAAPATVSNKQLPSAPPSPAAPTAPAPASDAVRSQRARSTETEKER